MSVEFLNDHRICFIGDSFVQGTGDPECLSWVGRVAAKAQAAGWKITSYNLGVPRDTSRDILARWALAAGIFIFLFPRLIWSEQKVKFQMKMGRIPSPGWG